MITFIEGHREVFGVGPICRVLGIAPSTFYVHKAVERDPERAQLAVWRIIPVIVSTMHRTSIPRDSLVIPYLSDCSPFRAFHASLLPELAQWAVEL